MLLHSATLSDGDLNFGYGDLMGATRIGDYMSWISSIVAPPIPGDYNGDGVADAADYSVWRKTDRTPQGYNTWRSQFRSNVQQRLRAVAFVAVPEPASAVMLMVGSLAICFRRRCAATP